MTRPSIAALTLALAGLTACPPAEEAPKPAADAAQAAATAKPPPPKPVGTWETLNDLPDGLAHPRATLLSDGRVFAYGDGDGRVGAILDPKAGTWTPTSAAKYPRAHHGQSLLPDGRVLLTGGTHIAKNYYVMRNAETFDPATGKWAIVESMPRRRSGHAQLALGDGRVLAVAGIPGGFVDPIREIDAYSPGTDKWKTLGTLAIGRRDHAVAPFGDGHLFVIGGTGSDGPLASAEICPAGEKRCRHVPVSGKREGPTATRLPSGHVLVTGGVKSRAAGVAELLLDPANQKLTPAAAPEDRRVGHTATLLDDGRVLVVGGARDSRHASAELYVPEEKAWVRAARPEARRHGHVALRLEDGSVLVLGGKDDADKLERTVERFVP